jgi:peptidoglycan hydrolase CwlO-like protein
MVAAVSTVADEPQTELVPLTPAERVAAVRRGLETALEKAETRIEKAQAKVDDAQRDLDDFDAAIEAVRTEG